MISVGRNQQDGTRFPSKTRKDRATIGVVFAGAGVVTFVLSSFHWDEVPTLRTSSPGFIAKKHNQTAALVRASESCRSTHTDSLSLASPVCLEPLSSCPTRLMESLATATTSCWIHRPPHPTAPTASSRSERAAEPRASPAVRQRRARERPTDGFEDQQGSN